MSHIADWIDTELYPTLFERIDIAFPEHSFKRARDGWHSKTYLDGTPHKTRSDKTKVTKKAPWCILENGGEAKGLVNYVMERDRVEFIQAVKTLADVAGVKPPTTEIDKKAYQRHREQATILEDVNSYFTYCLEKSKGAEEERSYLASRGYSKEDVRAMDLGYIPSQDKLKDYLKKRGYKESLIDETLSLNKGIGSTHRLTIPYRSGGAIKGFKFRTIGGHSPKYLNSTGLDRKGGLFNLSGIKGDKDVVIVEGELDSLSATARGVDNVVATGGSSISPEQIQDAIKRGAKSFTLCFDRETGKEEDTARKVDRAIDVILGEGINRVYTVTLPDLGGGKTDPDSLIKDKGVEIFKQAISKALTYWEYKLQRLLDKYSKVEEERGLEPRDIDKLLDEVVETASQIAEPTDRDLFKKLFSSLEAIKGLGITEESLDITVDRLTSSKDKERQDKELIDLLKNATNLQSLGATDKALELLTDKAKEVKLRDRATEFSKLLIAPKEEDLRERASSRPDSIDSGYTIGGYPLLLPSGAISVFTAPTSHGKTTLLMNLALNVATSSQEGKAYLFSYEEDRDSVIAKSLNVYLDEDISGDNRGAIDHYFRTGEAKYIKSQSREYFKAKREEYFRELIHTGRLNIQYSYYDSETLIEAIRYLHKNGKPSAILIDYVQLLKLPQGKYKTYSRQEEIKEVCLALKDVAVETGLPIVLGAQFNREVVNPLRLHPTKIGEAGDIERIASLIVGFWNNNLKPLASETELQEMDRKGYHESNTIYATVMKNRGGRVGLEEALSFNGNTGKIKNLENTGRNPFQ